MLFDDWRRYFERFEAGGIHLFCLSRLSSSKRHWLHSWPTTPSKFSSSPFSSSTRSLSASPDRDMVRRRRNPSTPSIPFHFLKESLKNLSEFCSFIDTWKFCPFNIKYSETRGVLDSKNILGRPSPKISHPICEQNYLE